MPQNMVNYGVKASMIYDLCLLVHPENSQKQFITFTEVCEIMNEHKSLMEKFKLLI